jgi:hypothetical protein
VRLAVRLLILGFALGAGAGSLLDARDACAQSDDERAAARAAATEGVRAFQEGRFKEALDFCTRAEALMHAPTHLLIIARSQVQLGHLVEAQEAYIRIERDPLAPGAPRAFFDAQTSASQEQAALAPRVPTLKVEVEGAAPKDVTLTLDGQRVASALIGLARPINPGDHTLSAKSATAASEPLTVTVAEGRTQEVRLTLRPGAPDAAGGAGAAAGANSASGDSADHPTEGHPNTGMRVGGWVAIGVGAVGVIAGTLFTLDNRSNRNSANALCAGPNGCPESRRIDVNTFDENANQAATLAWIGYGVGVAGLATGVTLLLMSGKSAAPPQSGRVDPWIGPRSAGLSVAF